MLSIKENSEKANSVTVYGVVEGDHLVFRVNTKELVEKAKVSKTGQSEGLMLKLNGEFTTKVPTEAGDVDAKVNLSLGRGGSGSWAVLAASKIIG